MHVLLRSPHFTATDCSIDQTSCKQSTALVLSARNAWCSSGPRSRRDVTPPDSPEDQPHRTMLRFHYGLGLVLLHRIPAQQELPRRFFQPDTRSHLESSQALYGQLPPGSIQIPCLVRSWFSLPPPCHLTRPNIASQGSEWCANPLARHCAHRSPYLIRISHFIKPNLFAA
jgi:hypothetical protein